VRSARFPNLQCWLFSKWPATFLFHYSATNKDSSSPPFQVLVQHPSRQRHVTRGASAQPSKRHAPPRIASQVSHSSSVPLRHRLSRRPLLYHDEDEVSQFLLCTITYPLFQPLVNDQCAKTEGVLIYDACYHIGETLFFGSRLGSRPIFILQNIPDTFPLFEYTFWINIILYFGNAIYSVIGYKSYYSLPRHA